jgi:hypothetical protein
MNSFLLSLWLAAAPDPWRCITPNIARIVQADCNQVALKEPAQVIGAAVEAEFHTTPVDCGFHLGRAGEREGHVGAASGLLGGHDAFQTRCCKIQKKVAQWAKLIVPIKAICATICHPKLVGLLNISLLYGNRRLFNQNVTDVAKGHIGRSCAFKDHKMACIWREVYPFGPSYPDQCATAGFNQKGSERAKSDLFMNLFNHTQLKYDRVITWKRKKCQVIELQSAFRSNSSR